MPGDLHPAVHLAGGVEAAEEIADGGQQNFIAENRAIDQRRNFPPVVAGQQEERRQEILFTCSSCGKNFNIVSPQGLKDAVQHLLLAHDERSTGGRRQLGWNDLSFRSFIFLSAEDKTRYIKNLTNLDSLRD